MKVISYLGLIFMLIVMISCNDDHNKLVAEVYETSASGNKLNKITEFSPQEDAPLMTILPNQEFQKITGFGGSFTEASAYLLNKLSKENRQKILEAYFGEDGFNIIASPWTAPPWMKDNKQYVGGKLLPKYNDAY